MSKRRPVGFHFYLITDRHQGQGRSLAHILETACKAGVKSVQLREKDLPPSALFHLAVGLKALFVHYRVKWLINDRIDIAQAVGASGVHLTENSLPAGVVRGIMGETPLIGVSTHELEGAQRAEAAGADFITYGPIFYTPSKAVYGEPKGLKQLEQIASRVQIPIFALGGITPERARACREAGACGVAAISAVLAATHIEQAISAFRDALGEL